MSKYFLLLLGGVIALTACGEDTPPVTPELNKLTKVTCYKNDAKTPVFMAEVNYTSDGKITNIQFAEGDKLLFIYSGNRFTVTDVSSISTTAEYILSGDIIVGKSISRKNPLGNNEVYTSDEYTYHYNDTQLSYTNWTYRWPRENGQEYETRMYEPSESYRWENGNTVLYIQDKKEAKYEYGSIPAPDNFPLRVIGSFNPVGFASVNPLNLMYGSPNRNFPIRSTVYAMPGQSDITAEYIFDFVTVGDYVTSMTIEEKDHTALEGSVRNTYKYTFEYNFKK